MELKIGDWVFYKVPGMKIWRDARVIDPDRVVNGEHCAFLAGICEWVSHKYIRKDQPEVREAQQYRMF